MGTTEPPYRSVERQRVDDAAWLRRGLAIQRAHQFPVRRVTEFVANEVAKEVLTDPELLIVARNRVNQAAASQRSVRRYPGWLARLLRLDGGEEIEVYGQELVGLMRLSGHAVDEDIVAHHTYVVQASFYLQLFEGANGGR